MGAALRPHLREATIVLLLAASLTLSVIDHGESREAIRGLQRNEITVRREAVHTRAVQRTGEPTGVCLREATRAALPILEDGADALEASEAKAPPSARAQVQLFIDLARGVERPLREYVKLQEGRYRGVSCPEPKP